MRRRCIYFFCFILSLLSVKTYAYDFAVENEDGVLIYYNRITNYNESVFQVTYGDKVGPNYSGDIVIPEVVDCWAGAYKVKSIGKNAFTNCVDLTSITIPNTVQYIGEEAFSWCDNLSSIVFSNSLETIGYKAFYNCKSLTSIELPDHLDYIDDSAFRECSNLSSVTFPESLTSIGVCAFMDCVKLTSIEIPNNVKRISQYAFSDCSNIKSVIIGESVLEIKDCAFQGCKEMKNLILGNSLKHIGKTAFISCSNLTSITIPNSVEEIEEGAFSVCVNVQTLTIGKSVATIGAYAFKCENLTTIVSLIEEPFEIRGLDLKGPSFHPNNYSNAILYVPEGCMEKYKTTNGWKDFNKIVEGEPSGISNFIEDKKDNLPIFDLNGRKLNYPQKGINIIGRKKILMK